MIHNHEIKVRGFHTDMFGHVNNARYLEFLEEARWEMLEEHIDYKQWEELNRAFIVVNINISYKRPSQLGDILRIQSAISKITGRSGTVNQEIYLKGTESIIAEADVTFVIIDTKTNKVVKIEGDIKRALHGLYDELRNNTLTKQLMTDR